MPFRSLLFVPGDSSRKIAKAEQVAADVVILDLEDAVAPGNKPAARKMVGDYLAHRRGQRSTPLYVRINPLATPDALPDLAAILGGAPDGIVQPKVGSADDVVQLGHYLDAFETQHDLVVGSTRILPVATEIPQAMFALGGYDRVGPRLVGITWGAEDLSAAIGAISNMGEDGHWSQPFALARSLCLFAAAAAGAAAIDTLHADFRDDAGLAASASQARRDGFAGKIAIHPDQVAIINAAFTPTPGEIAYADRIIALFAANPGAGTLSMDGRMIDMPHLVQARKTLAYALRAQGNRI